MPVYEMPGLLYFALFSVVSLLFLLKEVIILLFFVRKHGIKPGWLRLGAAILSIPLVAGIIVLAARSLQNPPPLNPYVALALYGLVFWGLVCLAAWYILRLTNRQGALLFAWMTGIGMAVTGLGTLCNFLLMPDQGFLMAVK